MFANPVFITPGRYIIVLVYSHEVISTESEKRPLKNDWFD